jgi:hypothetical protein
MYRQFVPSSKGKSSQIVHCLLQDWMEAVYRRFTQVCFGAACPKQRKVAATQLLQLSTQNPMHHLYQLLYIIQYDLHSSWWRAKEAGLVTRSIPVTFRSCVPQLARLHKYSFYTSVLQASFLPLFLFSPSRVSPTRLSAHSTVLCYSRPHSALVPEELVLVGC